MHTCTHMCRICTHIGCIVMFHGTCHCAVSCHLWRAAQWLLLSEEELDNALVVFSLLWQNGWKRNLKEGLLSLVVWQGTVHDGGGTRGGWSCYVPSLEAESNGYWCSHYRPVFFLVSPGPKPTECCLPSGWVFLLQLNLSEHILTDMLTDVSSNHRKTIQVDDRH